MTLSRNEHISAEDLDELISLLESAFIVLRPPNKISFGRCMKWLQRNRQRLRSKPRMKP